MIEPTVHRVWLGPNAMPDEFEGYWEAWQRLNPGMTFKTWREDDLDWLANRTVFEQAHNYSEQSDVARFELIRRFGGVYVDVDVEPIRPIEAKLERWDAVAGWEFSNRLGTAVLAGRKHHPAFVKLADELPRWVDEHDEATSEVRTGPVFLTTMWWKRTDVTRLGKEVFYPIGWWKGEERKVGRPFPAATITNHHWAASWVAAS